MSFSALPSRSEAGGVLSGAGVEVGESLEDAVRREALEEMGLTVEPEEPFYVCPTADGSHELHSLTARVVVGEPTPEPNEVQAWGWYSLDECARLENFFANDLAALRTLREQVKARKPADDSGSARGSHGATKSGAASHVEETLAAYRAHADAYAARPVDPVSSKRRAERLAAHLDAASLVVALGSGPGVETVALREAGLRVVGLDMTPEFLRIASERYPAEGYVRGDLRTLPFRDGSFAGAWASASLVHLAWAEVEGALAEISRVLRPGGIFHCSMQIGSSEGLMAPSASNPVRVKRFYAYYQPEEWRQRLSSTGFEVLHLESVRFDAGEAAERCNEGGAGYINATARNP